MLQQSYIRNQEFNLLTRSELSSSEWQWEGRTLSCLYIRSDDYPELINGKKVQPGSPIKLSGSYNTISGMWLMNKSEYPIKIYMIGPEDCDVSVLILEKNSEYPLGDSSDPYFKLHDVLTNHDKDDRDNLISDDVYYQKKSLEANENTYVDLSVIKDENTSILSIVWGDEEYVGFTRSDFYPEPIKDSTTKYNWEGQTADTDHQSLLNSFLNNGLSIYFTERQFIVKFLVDSQLCGDVQYVNYGKSAVKPSDPIKTGYTFKSWDKSDDILGNVTQDLDVNAVFDINVHNVYFKDWNDSLILTKENVEYGSNVTYPEHPTREDYNISGWIPESITSMPDNDVTVSALYSIKRYNVEFIDKAEKANYIDPEKQNGTYDIHSVITYPEISCREGYTWYCSPSEITNLTNDTSVYLYSEGKGLQVLGITVSGDVSNKSLKLNGLDHNLTGEDYSFVDLGDGLSSFKLYETDIMDGSEAIENADSAFYDLGENIYSIDFLEYTYLTSINDIANGCSSLTGVSLVNLTAVQSANRMFKDCVGMTSLSLGNNTFIDRINDDETFANCQSLQVINFKDVLSSYNSNGILSTAFGQATYVSVDVNEKLTYSTLSNGIYGQDEMTLITIAGDLVNLYFDVSGVEGAKSGIDGNLKWYEKNQRLGDLPTPECYGYSTTEGTRGWVWEDGTPLINTDTISTNVSCRISLQLNTYTISYEKNGGTINESYNDTYTIKSYVVLPTNVTKDEYDFLGWYDVENPTEEDVAVTEIPVGSTGNVKFWAQWSKKKYSLSVVINTETYDKDGVVLSENDNTGGEILGVGEYEYNTTKILSAIPSEGFEFKCWNNVSTDNSTTKSVTLTQNTTLSATFNSLDQSLVEYFNVETGTPEEDQATILGLNSTGSSIVRYLEIPENIEKQSI